MQNVLEEPGQSEGIPLPLAQMICSVALFAAMAALYGLPRPMPKIAKSLPDPVSAGGPAGFARRRTETVCLALRRPIQRPVTQIGDPQATCLSRSVWRTRT